MSQLCIPYNQMPLNTQAIGKIFRIYNKNNNKSYINYTNNNIFTLSNIINKLKTKQFDIELMQNDWNTQYSDFFAEDLQLYYTNGEIPVLMINWQKYFGGNNYELLYNIEEFNDYKDLDTILDENKYYLYYTTQLLNINKDLQEQLKILNQNYVNLQTYNDQTKNDLISINALITNQIKNSPIQILQMLTSLLTITSAECNIQFNKLNLCKPNNIQINSAPIKTDNNLLPQNNNNIQVNNITDKIVNSSKNEEKKTLSDNNNTQVYYNKVNAAIQILQQYIPNLKRLIKTLRNNQYITANNKEKMKNEIENIQQLFNRINAQLLIYKENALQLNNPLQFNNIINKINKQVQSFKNDFNTLKNNINNRIKQVEAKINSSKIKTDNLNMNELMELKLQKSNDTSQHTNTNTNTNTDIQVISSSIATDNENNLRLFPLFNGKYEIKTWISIAYQWLINNQFIDFAQELKSEVYKSLINKNPTKALTYAIASIKGLSYDDIAKQFNTTKIMVMRNIDSLQNTHPAIYLALGYRSKTSQGKNKRVINSLKAKKIINIPNEL